MGIHRRSGKWAGSPESHAGGHPRSYLGLWHCRLGGNEAGINQKLGNWQSNGWHLYLPSPKFKTMFYPDTLLRGLQNIRI
jgi:hypothetical protein